VTKKKKEQEKFILELNHLMLICQCCQLIGTLLVQKSRLIRTHVTLLKQVHGESDKEEKRTRKVSIIELNHYVNMSVLPTNCNVIGKKSRLLRMHVPLL
jgi:hypothetical protein